MRSSEKEEEKGGSGDLCAGRFCFSLGDCNCDVHALFLLRVGKLGQLGRVRLCWCEKSECVCQQV